MSCSEFADLYQIELDLPPATLPVAMSVVRRIGLLGRSAQRHKGGVRRTEDSRGAECAGGQIHKIRLTGIGMS